MIVNIKDPIHSITSVEIGLKLIAKNEWGERLYEVIDKQLFFLSVIKNGIEYKYICEV